MNEWSVFAKTSIHGFLLLIVTYGDKLTSSQGLFLINILRSHVLVMAEAIREPHLIQAIVNMYL